MRIIHGVGNEYHWLDKNNYHLSAWLAHKIPSGRPRPYVWVWPNMPSERQNVGSTPLCSPGVSITSPYTMRTCSKPTWTHPTRRTRMLRNVKIGQLKSTPNTIHWWEGTGVPSLSRMEDARHPQPQLSPCFYSAGINYPNFGMRKDSDL